MEKTIRVTYLDGQESTLTWQSEYSFNQDALIGALVRSMPFCSKLHHNMTLQSDAEWSVEFPIGKEGMSSAHARTPDGAILAGWALGEMARTYTLGRDAFGGRAEDEEGKSGTMKPTGDAA